MHRLNQNANLAAPDSSTWIRRTLVRQFGRPTGLVGQLAGWSMALRPSNKQRNKWTVDLLRLQPGEKVLEVGFGPGLALHHAAVDVGGSGYVAGVDPSPVMLRQAGRRNHRWIAEGRMDLRVATVENLPDFGMHFDAILAVNTLGFWPDPTGRLRELRARLRPGGRLAVTVQPRSPKADAATSERIRRELLARFENAQFGNITSDTLDIDPPAVCVIGMA